MVLIGLVAHRLTQCIVLHTVMIYAEMVYLFHYTLLETVDILVMTVLHGLKGHLVILVIGDVSHMGKICLEMDYLLRLLVLAV